MPLPTNRPSDVSERVLSSTSFPQEQANTQSNHLTNHYFYTAGISKARHFLSWCCLFPLPAGCNSDLRLQAGTSGWVKPSEWLRFKKKKVVLFCFKAHIYIAREFPQLLINALNSQLFGGRKGTSKKLCTEWSSVLHLGCTSKAVSQEHPKHLHTLQFSH